MVSLDQGAELQSEEPTTSPPVHLKPFCRTNCVYKLFYLVVVSLLSVSTSKQSHRKLLSAAVTIGLFQVGTSTDCANLVLLFSSYQN